MKEVRFDSLEIGEYFWITKNKVEQWRKNTSFSATIVPDGWADQFEADELVWIETQSDVAIEIPV